jgi:deferrochelatase/peroxidase EfeB
MPHDDQDPEPRAAHGVSRRGLFGALAAGGAMGLLAAGAGARLGATIADQSQPAASTYPFFGEHPAGITTPMQDRVHFAAFDLDADASRDDLIDLLQRWSYAASRLQLGLDVSASGAVGGSEYAPPDDTGEALGLPPSGLTITIGFGPGIFEDADGNDRFGVKSQRPDALAPLPAFAGDDLSAAISGGDLAVQACADDPQVAVHAIRNLTRMAFGTATLRWSALGFGRTASTSRAQATPRNLFGFKDGTSNIMVEDTQASNDHVWVQPGDGPDWLTGGSYMIMRRIRMIIESWDRVQLGEQEQIFGRDKGEGAPLSGGDEFTAPNFAATDAAGAPLIDVKSHVHLAHPEQNSGTRILRRAYNYVDGNDELGRLDAGLLFICFQRDPQQFIDIQRNLSRDLLNEYIRHVSSGVWAVPPVLTEGSYAGAALFGD